MYTPWVHSESGQTFYYLKKHDVESKYGSTIEGDIELKIHLQTGKFSLVKGGEDKQIIINRLNKRFETFVFSL
jgi:hypothetical protein